MPFAIAVEPSVESAVMTNGLEVAAAACHVLPASVLYCQPVMADPPSLASETAIVSDRSPRVTPVMVGCAGVVRGMPAREPDAGPLPCELRARTVMPYEFPFVRPLMRKLVPSVPVSTQPDESSWYW